MGIRLLYQQIPPSQRLCHYYRCNEPVLRNIDRDEHGHIYHHGCLLTAQEEYFKCLDCFTRFDATEAAFEATTETQREGYISQVLKPLCPGCGSPNIRRK